MDAGADGTSSRDEQLGIRHLIRYLPVLLHRLLERRALCHIVDRIGANLPSIPGRGLLRSFLQVLAVSTASVSTRYGQLFLAQGVCKGLRDGSVFRPIISLVATYFSRNRVVAVACAASGAATGGIIFPVIAQQLLSRIGFAWTVRAMAFIISFNSVVAFSIAHVRLPPRRTGPLVEWNAFKELSYTLFCVGMFLDLWAVCFACFYVSPDSNI